MAFDGDGGGWGGGLRLAVLVIATSWLTGCGTAGFEANGAAACPPVVEYSREFQALAVEELALLQEELTVIKIMSDYAVLWQQAFSCSGSFQR